MMSDKMAPVHPGEILLEEFLKPMGLSQNKLAMLICLWRKDSAARDAAMPLDHLVDLGYQAAGVMQEGIDVMQDVLGSESLTPCPPLHLVERG